MEMERLFANSAHPYLWFVLLFRRSVSGLGGWGFFAGLLGLGLRFFVVLQLILALEIALFIHELTVCPAEKMEKLLKINFIVNVSELVVAVVKQFIFGPLFATFFHPWGYYKG